MTSQAIRKTTERAERLDLAIEHFCGTELSPREEKLIILDRAENYMMYVSQSATNERHTSAEMEKRRYIPSRLSWLAKTGGWSK